MFKGVVLITILIILNPYTSSFRFPICPEVCYCNLDFTDCKYNELATLPPDLDFNITSLDLSHNEFEQIPSDLRVFKYLRYLNLSYNKVSVLRHSALEGLDNLEWLDLTYNMFFDWMDVKSQAFSTTKNLVFLDFSHNPLRSVPQQINPLKIDSLQVLKLNNCSMLNLYGNIFEKLPKIKEFHAAQNPIKYLNTTFTSSTLKFMDLRMCGLRHIHNQAFDNLTSLETLYLSRNRNLKKFSCSSDSLLYLDLSDCNLEFVPDGYLPKVQTANFHGNHFRTISRYNFFNYRELKNLDLSYNAIDSIDAEGFFHLPNTEIIDLSFNTLSFINKSIFMTNDQLSILNLSHNYFSRVPRIMSASLQVLDLSSCEIQVIDKDNLVEMPNIRVLYLSRNVISSIPNFLTALNLKTLDLSLCHIKSISNKTFASAVSLRNLNLSGNRLTTLSPDCFTQVTSLNIVDNPWRCDCQELRPMYFWLIKIGTRIDKLLCESPEKVEGLSWSSACQSEWDPPQKKDQIWWYSVGLIGLTFVLFFFVLAMRKVHQVKEQRVRREEENRRAEEREALRRMRVRQLELREEESRNAPDPRELQGPPSYNDALLLPKLDASHPSLAGSLHSIASSKDSNPDISRQGRKRRKRRRRKSDSTGSQRASKVIASNDDSDTTDAEQLQHQQPHQEQQQQQQQRPTLESDF